MALWFAARGMGTSLNDAPYHSTSRVLLSGLGADEQLGGYSRHLSAFQSGSWQGLLSEIQMDVDRISTRNLGRDDRIMSDHGKEVRFPFLDTDVIHHLCALAIHFKADLRLKRGFGDKILLRLLAKSLGLPLLSQEPKRAIQFGARTAKLESNKDKGHFQL